MGLRVRGKNRDFRMSVPFFFFLFSFLFSLFSFFALGIEVEILFFFFRKKDWNEKPDPKGNAQIIF
jgi:hypothetical protein